jgi:hypothetical protein
MFTGPPSDLGFQENTGSAAPVQHLLGAFPMNSGICFAKRSTAEDTMLISSSLIVFLQAQPEINGVFYRFKLLFRKAPKLPYQLGIWDSHNTLHIENALL